MKRELLTLAMTASILVSLLAFTQPTAAVLTTVEGPDEVRQPGPMAFDVAVEIREDERIPIESFDLVIETDEGESVTVTFAPDGTVLTVTPDRGVVGDGDIRIDKLRAGLEITPVASDAAFGYGYLSGTNERTGDAHTFGYGYGYGYGDAQPSFRFQISMESEAFKRGEYTMQLRVNTDGEGDAFASNEKSFEVLKPVDGPPDDETERNINISVDGNVTPGETVTLTATLHGEPVPHAPVEVNGETVGETDENGQIDVTVPDEDEFEVEIEPDFEGETTVPIDGGETDEDEADDDDDDEDRRIDLAIDGNVSAGEDVTVTATVNGTPLANAEISVNGEAIGTTDANGSIVVTVPMDADEFEVEAEFDEKGKLKIQLAEDDDEGEDDHEAEFDEIETADDDDRELAVDVSGDVTPGGNVTVSATQDGTPIEDARVKLRGDVVGWTDADGTLDVTLPTGVDEVEIDVKSGELESKWKVKFKQLEGAEADDG